jgi:signal transduction histidine kinase
MTAFIQQPADEGITEVPPEQTEPVKRPPRWSLANWPVRWKVLAIVLIPLVLAGTFGWLRVYSSAAQAQDLRRAADRAEMVPAIESFMAALEGALVAGTEGRDTQSAVAQFDRRGSELRQRLADTDVVPDVRLAVNTLLDYGQDLVNKVMSNAIDLRQRVTTYAPLLLTAETAITGSVSSDDQEVRLQAEALSRAVGARGQMAMQQMLVSRGGDMPEPVLRNSLMRLAGTEPSTISGMSKMLGGASEQASTLRSEWVKRGTIISDPAAVLAGNPELLKSQQATAQVADQLIADTTSALPAKVIQEAAAQRTAAVRDAALVLAAIVVAMLLVTLVARSLVLPLRMLRDSALKVAHDDLAREIDRVRAGEEPGPVAPIAVHTTEEVGQVAHAVDELHEQAVFLAGEQARLQMQVGDMFETLSRRSRSLVDQQLALIDRLERTEEDPERLESLFKLDHLAARMRRNGANLLVLAGAEVPRQQAQPVAVSTMINAAASEVEDYTRVVTATAPDSEIIGSAAGDLVHLLAELLDNALRYSPPISQVRVSAVHTGNGGLVIEVSDIGLGMNESDLRVANTRLSSGGEVNPYTARHMGLFVVGRLAQQHGLVVRLRSTIAGEPSSGTTAGVYVPAELIVGARPSGRFPEAVDIPADARSGIATALALDHESGEYVDNGAELVDSEYPNGHADVPVALLPHRHPGASGISDIPASVGTPIAAEDTGWPADAAPAPTMQPDPSERPAHDQQSPTPTDTSAFFASRPQPGGNGLPEDHARARHAADQPSATAHAEEPIYQKMLSEWLIDPTELAKSSDLNWQFVWDHGWSAAAAAEEAPVLARTEHGLPVREPGTRLVPGAVDSAVPGNGGQPNGGAHHAPDGDAAEPEGRRHLGEVASVAEPDTGPGAIPRRDPDAVRASISNHFGGVHAGRSHARDTRGTDNE